jgi:hypothetical protein
MFGLLLPVVVGGLLAFVGARMNGWFQNRSAARNRAQSQRDAAAREAEQALLGLQGRAFFAPDSAGEIHNEFENLAAPRATAVGNAEVDGRIERVRLLLRHASTVGSGHHWQYAVGTAIEDARFGLLAYLLHGRLRRARLPTTEEIGIWAAQGPEALWRELARHLARTCG